MFSSLLFKEGKVYSTIFTVESVIVYGFPNSIALVTNITNFYVGDALKYQLNLKLAQKRVHIY